MLQNVRATIKKASIGDKGIEVTLTGVILQENQVNELATLVNKEILIDIKTPQMDIDEFIDEPDSTEVEPENVSVLDELD